MAGFLASPFGNGTDTGSGGNVNTALGAPHNFFGPRQSGGASGVLLTDGAIEQLVFSLTGEELNDVLGPLTPQYLPIGSVIRDVWWDTDVAFTLTGTAPTILVGTKTTEVTNGLVITQAQAQSTNTARLTASLTGTWAVNTPLQARTQIGFAIGGTGGPTVDRVGKGRLTIEVIRPNNFAND